MLSTVVVETSDESKTPSISGWLQNIVGIVTILVLVRILRATRCLLMRYERVSGQ